jgi:hypothetical protein
MRLSITKIAAVAAVLMTAATVAVPASAEGYRGYSNHSRATINVGYGHNDYRFGMHRGFYRHEMPLRHARFHDYRWGWHHTNDGFRR